MVEERRWSSGDRERWRRWSRREVKDKRVEEKEMEERRE